MLKSRIQDQCRRTNYVEFTAGKLATNKNAKPCKRDTLQHLQKLGKGSSRLKHTTPNPSAQSSREQNLQFLA